MEAKIHRIIILSLLAFLVSSQTGFAADCWYGNERYSPGTIKGDYVCGSDGYWKKLPPKS